MSKVLDMMRGFYRRFRKRGAVAVVIVVAIELIAGAAVAIAGRERIKSGAAASQPQETGSVLLGSSASLSTPSLRVF